MLVSRTTENDAVMRRMRNLGYTLTEMGEYYGVDHAAVGAAIKAQRELKNQTSPVQRWLADESVLQELADLINSTAVTKRREKKPSS